MPVNFLIPPDFRIESVHTLNCKANYFNLGSRSDPFSTTFKVENRNFFGRIFGELGGGIKNNIQIVVAGIVFLLVLVGLFLLKRRKKKGE